METAKASYEGTVKFKNGDLQTKADSKSSTQTNAKGEATAAEPTGEALNPNLQFNLFGLFQDSENAMGGAGLEATFIPRLSSKLLAPLGIGAAFSWGSGERHVFSERLSPLHARRAVVVEEDGEMAQRYYLTAGLELLMSETENFDLGLGLNMMLGYAKLAGHITTTPEQRPQTSDDYSKSGLFWGALARAFIDWNKMTGAYLEAGVSSLPKISTESDYAKINSGGIGFEGRGGVRLKF